MTTELLVDLLATDGDEFDSENVYQVGYDRETQTLYVEFQSADTVYSYVGVYESTYNLLVNAPSVGRFVNTHIKGKGFGGEKYEDALITLRDEPEVEVTTERKPQVGDRVVITSDDKFPGGTYWNGPGTITEVHDFSDTVIIKPDHLNTTGGFKSDEWAYLEDGGEQGDRKWLSTDSDESPFATDVNEVNGFLDTLTIGPSKYGVTWTDGGLTFEPTFEAMSEADALAQFQAAISATGIPHAEVRKVTHYFE